MSIETSNKSYTIVDRIQSHALKAPESISLIFLDEHLNEEFVFSYAELNRLAMNAASYIRQFTQPGERAVLMLPSGPELALCILGCLYAGVVAVPVQPVTSLKSSKWQRVCGIVSDSDARFLVTLDRQIEKTKSQITDVAPNLSVSSISVKSLLLMSSEQIFATPKSSELAVLQYTSGSTGDPKGVMISHANIIANQKIIQDYFCHDQHTIGCSWLPLHHDMGLMGNLFQPLFLGVKIVLMSPLCFIRNPDNWLKVVSKYQATSSSAPNFGYDLCVTKINNEKTLEVDLSSWKVAAVGAEPIRATTLERFAQKFEAYGFHKSSLYPCYGLAEATLLVVGSVVGEEAVISTFTNDELRVGKAKKIRNGELVSPQDRRLVSSGLIRNTDNLDLRIVDPNSNALLGNSNVGEIWINNTSLSSGYWGNEVLSQTTFQATTEDGRGPYLRTGDTGFIDEQQLYVVGRIKDLIIIRGVNHTPQDIEATVQGCSELLIKDAGAAFAIDHECEERLIVVQEVIRNKGDAVVFEELLNHINETIITTHEVEPLEILLIREASLPKTTSGKIQRYLARDLYLDGALLAKAKKRTATGRQASSMMKAEKDVSALSVDGVVVRLWSEILNLPVSSIDQSIGLFDLGGDSLKVAQLLTGIRECFDVDVPLENLYETPTIETLVLLIESALDSDGEKADEDMEEEVF